MIPALVFIFIASVSILAWWVRRRREARRGPDVLLRAAIRLGLPERLDGDSSIRFERRGFPALVAIHPGARLNVEVSFKLQEESVEWLTVSSVGFRRAFLEQFGLEDFQVGETHFDERFEVWGRNEAFVREKLTADIRSMLFQVDRRWTFLMRLTPDQLTLRARAIPLERYQIETLVGIAYQLLDLFGPTSPADFVLAKVQEKINDETRCPVCGSPLSRGRLVRCAKCRAAHHADCWQFNGLCATFACGSQTHER